MKIATRSILGFLFLISAFCLCAQTKGKMDAVYSGLPWFDDKGNTVSAHGANIIKENGMDWPALMVGMPISVSVTAKEKRY